MTAPIYKQSALARTALYLLMMSFSLVFAPPSKAETASMYTVEGVEIDVTAENAVKAREKAMDEAQVKAYKLLLERLLGEEAAQKLPELGPVAVSVMVQDFEVTKEQLSARRYKGTYTVRFRPAQVINRLAGLGANVPDPSRKPVLVLPFYQTGGRTVLWSDANPWMVAWRTAPAIGTVLPMGDAHDMAQVRDTEGLQYNPIEVQELAARYGADDVAILLASPEPVGTQGRLAVNVYNNGFNGPSFAQKIVVDQQPGETAEALFARAASQARTLLATGNWKTIAGYNPAMPVATPHAQQQPTNYAPLTQYQQQQQQRTASPVPYTRPALGTPKTYAARARFASVQDWVRMKNTLDNVYGMQAVMIKSLRSREALIDISYAGDIPSLQLALQNAGIMMRGAQDGSLEIYTGAGMTPVYR